MHTDDEDLRLLVEAMQQGWNAGDGTAYARPFAEDAIFVTVTGLRAEGRELIGRGHQELFGTVFAGTSIALTVDAIRYLRPDVALVELTSTVASPGGGRQVTRPLVVATRDGDAWAVAALHDMVPAGRPVAGPVEAGLLR